MLLVWYEALGTWGRSWRRVSLSQRCMLPAVELRRARGRAGRGPQVPLGIQQHQRVLGRDLRARIPSAAGPCRRRGRQHGRGGAGRPARAGTRAWPRPDVGQPELLDGAAAPAAAAPGPRGRPCPARHARHARARCPPGSAAAGRRRRRRRRAHARTGWPRHGQGGPSTNGSAEPWEKTAGRQAPSSCGGGRPGERGRAPGSTARPAHGTS